MYRCGAAILALGCGLTVWGQDAPAGALAESPRPAILENNGKPMLLPFQCTDEDIRAAGLSCSDEEPCPTFLELSSVAPVGNSGRILAVGNLHSEAVTLYSVLLFSEDAGRTWSEVSGRIRGASLDRIQFRDSEKGWVSGQELSPLPQNPFLLLTTDGGKTWRQRPILNEASENRFGTIQQFSFTAQGVGSLVLDRGQGAEGGRYVLYESPDGGENWQIKQESTKPIPLPAAAPAPADWRVRADAASKSFHIERRQGERWTTVGSFLVRVEPCKPPKPADGAAPAEDKPAPPKPPIKKQQ